ncbi:MAG TPA: class I SAM-dependent methyltransferase [Anaerolineae bacterium]
MPESHVGQAWAEHFKSEAESYRIKDGIPFLRRFIRSPFIQLMWRYGNLKPGNRVLEAGCASGKFSVCFAMLGCTVTALDFSTAMLENTAHLRQTVAREIGPLNMQLIWADLENLNLEPDQFDLVFNEGVVEHWLDHAERRTVLDNMMRIAKPGGVVAIIIPNGHHPRMWFWMTHSPAFLSAPPMVRYDPKLLHEDLTSIGLTDLFIDGIYAWRTIDQWPTSRARQIIGGVLQRLIPLPRQLRLRWGIHLIGMGRKT